LAWPGATADLGAADADAAVDDGFGLLNIVADTNVLALDATLGNLRAVNGAGEKVEGADKVNNPSTKFPDDLGSRIASIGRDIARAWKQKHCRRAGPLVKPGFMDLRSTAG
jgi:hypothetical protein